MRIANHVPRASFLEPEEPPRVPAEPTRGAPVPFSARQLLVTPEAEELLEGYGGRPPGLALLRLACIHGLPELVG